MYRIVADSSCDLFALQGVSFGTVPLTISTDARHYRDDEALDIPGMIRDLLEHKGRSYTACPNAQDWLNVFTAEDGRSPDELYVVTLTSALSGTWNSAVAAREQYLEQHPQAKVLIVDSLSVGPEMVLLLEKIRELKQLGATYEQVEREITAYSKKTRLFFAFRSLHNLAQNGRVNKLVAAAAGVLGISVYGTADDTGHIQSLGKARGENKVIAVLTDAMVKAGCKGGRFRISHTENEDLAQRLKQAILAMCPGADVIIHPVRGLCAYYCERGGICVACET